MRFSSVTTASLFGAALTLGAASIASAQYQAQPPVYQQQQQPVYQQRPPGYAPGRYRVHDIRWVQAHVGTAVLTLNRETRGYGGHRAAALGLLRYANRELRAAIGFAAAHGYQPTDLGEGRPGYREGYAERQAPDRIVFNAQRGAQVWIDMLQRDNRDYGGHRVAAIQNLERAESELTAALQTGE